MEKDLFKFIEQNDSNKQFENHLNASFLSQIKGGNTDSNPDTEEPGDEYCNPWYACDAWNCAPDCICKNNLA